MRFSHTEIGGGLSVNVFGWFRLVDATGAEFTPRSMKAKGLLALLIATPNATKSRAWLQSKLWSDRSSEQASASLRRALADIRKALGPHKDILRTNSSSVALDLETLTISYCVPPHQIENIEVTPFDGIDINDAEFEDLIRDIRTGIMTSNREKNAAASPSSLTSVNLDIKNTVIIETRSVPGTLSYIASQVFTDKVIKYLNQLGSFEILTSHGGLSGAEASKPAASTRLCRLRITAIPNHADIFFGCEIGKLSSERVLWSDSLNLSNEAVSYAEQPDLAKLVHTTAAQICTAFADQSLFGNNQHYALYYMQKANNLLFQLDKSSLIKADILFTKAHEVFPNGVALAWRAFLRLTAQNQHHMETVFSNTDDIDSLLTEALRLSPNHPSVRAICSQMELFNHGDLRFSLAMAKLAYDENSSDPMICAVLSNALLRDRKFEESYAAACRAVNISQNDKNHYYFHHFACMSAAAKGEYGLALSHASVGLGLRSDFVSLRRYQIALAIQGNHVDQIQMSLAALRKEEHNFSINSLIDPSYPVPTLQQLPMIKKINAYTI